LQLGQSQIAPGDKIIVSRSIGEHGLCILAQRYNMDCGTLQSDCASLAKAVEVIIKQTGNGGKLKFMRDATRGGVLGIISEIFEKSACNATVYENLLPVSSNASAIARLLGIDPGFAACEGCMVAVIAPDCAEACVELLHTLPGCEQAAIIGEVVEGSGNVNLRGEWGSLRKLVVPAGDQLPRIC
jgi:hydrogenase expression/formation protein HypE